MVLGIKIVVMAVLIYIVFLHLLIMTMGNFAPELKDKRVVLWLWFGLTMVVTYSTNEHFKAEQALIYPWASYALMCLYPISLFYKANPGITIQDIFIRMYRGILFGEGKPEEHEEQESVGLPPTVYRLAKLVEGDKGLETFVDKLPLHKPKREAIVSAVDRLVKPSHRLNIVDQILDDFLVFIEGFDPLTLYGCADWIDSLPEEKRLEAIKGFATTWYSPIGGLIWEHEFAKGFEELNRSIQSPVMMELADDGTPLIDFFVDPKEGVLPDKWQKVFDKYPTRHDPCPGLRGYRAEISRMKVALTLPRDLRTEHHLVVASSGHGKSTLFLDLILEDLKTDRPIIVIDSQRTLINGNPSKKHWGLLDVVPEERIVHIDPTDPDYDLAVNVFDAGDGDMMEYLFAGTEDFTPRQATVYRYLSLLIQRIDGGNIKTLMKILQDRTAEAYLDEISEMNDTAQSFFAEFNKIKGGEYTSAKGEILRRFHGLLSNESLDGFFSSTTTRIDIAEEINANKVIMVDTSKGHLGSAFSIFGRFWLASIRQAMFSNRITKSPILYIDEAQEYFTDEKMIGELFQQARKFDVGIVIATQGFSDMSTSLQNKIMGCSIKFAGSTSYKDASTLSKEMGSDAETIKEQPKFKYVASFKGRGTTTWETSVKNIPLRDSSTKDRIRDSMRAKYYTTHTEPDIVVGTVVNPDEVEEKGEW